MLSYQAHLVLLPLVAALLSAAFQGATAPPTAELKSLAFAAKPAAAKELFESSVPDGPRLDAEWLEAMSWVARAGAIGEDWSQAAEYSERTLAGCEGLLTKASLSQDPQAALPIALGAAIETLGKFYAAMNDRGQAVAFLREMVGAYRGTSIETRLNKNLNALDLAGQPMPELSASQWLTERRFDLSDLRGKVTLFFFWAHWCSDCEAQKPVLAELEKQYSGRGLRIVAPTRLYGYIRRGSKIGAEQERKFIEQSRLEGHPLLARVPVPLDQANFVAFGVSTTPTLVLVDRKGIVRMYHPGEMPRSELAERIEALL